MIGPYSQYTLTRAPLGRTRCQAVTALSAWRYSQLTHSISNATAVSLEPPALDPFAEE